MDPAKAHEKITWETLEALATNGGDQLSSRLEAIVRFLQNQWSRVSKDLLVSHQDALFKILAASAQSGKQEVYGSLSSILAKGFPAKEFPGKKVDILRAKIIYLRTQKNCEPALLEAYVQLGSCAEVKSGMRSKCVETLLARRAPQLALKVLAASRQHLTVDTATCELVRDLLQQVECVDQLKPDTQELIDLCLHTCLAEQRNGLAYSLLCDAIGKQVYDEHSSPDAQCVRSLITANAQELSSLAILGLMDSLMQTAWNDLETWKMVFEFHDKLSGAEQQAALDAAGRKVDQELVTHWRYTWALRSLEAEDFKQCADQLCGEGPGHLAAHGHCSELRSRLYAKARELDPTFEQVQLWTVLWAADVRVPADQRELSFKEALVLFSILPKRTAVELTIKTIYNPHHLPQKMSQEEFETWSKLHEGMCDHVLPLELAGEMISALNPACFSMDEDKTDSCFNRWHLLAIVMQHYLLLASSIERSGMAGIKRSDLYDCLKRAGIEAALSHPTRLSEAIRISLARQADHVYLTTLDVDVARLFLQSLQLGKADYVNAVWVRPPEEIDQKRFVASCLIMSQQWLEKEDHRDPELVLKAQSLCGFLEPQTSWKPAIALKLVRTDEPALCHAGVEICLRAIAHSSTIDDEENRRRHLTHVGVAFCRALSVLRADELKGHVWFSRPLTEVVQEALAARRVPKKEIAAVITAIHFIRCQTYAGTARFIEAVKMLTDYVAEQGGAEGVAELLPLFQTLIVDGIDEFKDVFLVNHSLYQVIRELAVSGLQLLKHADMWELVPALHEQLWRLSAQCNDDPRAQQAARMHLSTGISALIRLSDSQPPSEQLWQTSVNGIREGIAFFQQHDWRCPSHSERPHQTMRTILFQFKDLAVSCSAEYDLPERRQQLLPLGKQLVELQQRINWPVGDATQWLLYAQVLLCDQPTDQLVDVTQIPGYDLHVVNTAMLTLMSEEDWKFNKELREKDLRYINLMFKACEQAIATYRWVPDQVLTTLALGLGARVFEFATVHGQQEGEQLLRRCWSIVNTSKLYKDMNPDNIKERITEMIKLAPDVQSRLIRLHCPITLDAESLTARHHCITAWQFAQWYATKGKAPAWALPLLLEMMKEWKHQHLETPGAFVYNLSRQEQLWLRGPFAKEVEQVITRLETRIQKDAKSKRKK